MTNESDPGHGNSPAAWIAVITMLVGFTVGTLAFWFDLPAIVFVGVGIVILGAILGLVFKRLGYGVGGARVTSKAHH